MSGQRDESAAAATGLVLLIWNGDLATQMFKTAVDRNAVGL